MTCRVPALCSPNRSRFAGEFALNYLSAAIPLINTEPIALLDRAIAERMLPAILAGAPLQSLRALPTLLDDLPRSSALLAEPLPIRW